MQKHHRIQPARDGDENRLSSPKEFPHADRLLDLPQQITHTKMLFHEPNEAMLFPLLQYLHGGERFISKQPVADQVPLQGLESIKLAAIPYLFGLEKVCAHRSRARYVHFPIRTGKHGDDQIGEGISLQPFEDLEAIHARHFQIQQQQIREWVIAAIPKFAVSIKVSNCLLAVRHAWQEPKPVKPSKSHFQQKAILLGIISKQHQKFRVIRSCHMEWQIYSEQEKYGNGAKTPAGMPKSEWRNPKEARNLKPEQGCAKFLRASDFGLRICEIGGRD